MTDAWHLMVVRDGLVADQGSLGLHPALQAWSRQLAAGSRRWFRCAPMTALEWYGLVCGLSGAPAAWLATGVETIPQGTIQCWVATPYHAVAGRHEVHVAPEEVLDWQATDAHRLAELLNPLLEAEGMQLLHIGAAMLAVCKRSWDVTPQGFGRIAGGRLPNRSPQGADGGRFSRLQAEIQMLLAQHPLSREAGRPQVSGVWFWGGSPWPAGISGGYVPVMSDDAGLRDVFGALHARLAVLCSEAAAQAMERTGRLPTAVLLAGSTHCVLLRRGLLPRLWGRDWRPRGSEPMARLQGLASA